MRLLRPLPLVVLVVALCLGVAGAVTLLGDRTSTRARSTGSVGLRAAEDAARTLALLGRWDRARAAAYASGDVAALRRLYVPGSAAGAVDVRVLRGYRDRGLALRGLELQRSEAVVLAATSRRLRVEVVERLAGGTVVAAGAVATLPSDRPERRVVTLARQNGRWRVASVTAVGARSVVSGAVSAGPRRSGP